MMTDIQLKIIRDTEIFVENFMKSYDCSHDFKHVLRVKNMATVIAVFENLRDYDIFEIQLAALTHDVGDHKYNKISKMSQEEILRDFFKDKLDSNTCQNVVNIATNVSLSKEVQESNKISNCKKLHCVQDADRLDSLGSIGISRYFAYGLIQNNSTIEEIFTNIENRSKILMQHIKTDYGKREASKKIILINLLIEDYKNSI